MIKRITIFFLSIILVLLFAISAFALIRPSETAGWKEDILTLLSLVKRVGDYSEVVELIEVAPALKKDLEIRKAFITFAPPGATPPEWAREEEIAPPVRIEVPEKIPVEVEERPVPPPVETEIKKEEISRPTPVKREARPLTKEEKKEVREYYLIGKRYYNAKEDEKAIEEFERALALDPTYEKAIKYSAKSHYHLGRKYYKNKEYQKAKHEFENALAKNPEHKKAKEYFAKLQARIEEKGERARVEEARRIAQEVAAQREIQRREAAPPEIIKGEPKIEVPKEVEIVTEGPPKKIGVIEEVPVKEEIKEELGAIPTPLPPGAKVIHSTDVISGVKAEIVEGKTKVTITLSGERKYTTSERGRPPAVIIDIPHTINAIFPERIMVNQGCVRTIEVTQLRTVPFDETRIVINLSRFKEYEIKSKENEIYVEFGE